MIDIPSRPLADALSQLSAGTGLAIGGLAPGIASVRSSAVRANLSPAAALRRMLRGTGFKAVKLDYRTYRLERDSTSAERLPYSLALTQADSEILVTASKRRLSLRSLGGAAEVASLDGPLAAGDRGGGLVGLTSRIPALTSTNLGPARDKLAIRGVSDSSFTGQARSTVGQYLGEARINLNAPDPNLLLYDVGRIEVLKGPQGTLYGSSALGGVVRIVPNAPDLSRRFGWVDVATTLTEHGAQGQAISLMANLPLTQDRVALRTVLYRNHSGGYVDDIGRGLSDVNRTTITGGRGKLRGAVGGWTIDLSGAQQWVRTRDSQYTERSIQGLSRESWVAQPFRSVFSMGEITARREIGPAELLTTTSVLRQKRRADYDATVLTNEPTRFADREHITSVAHETRLASSLPDGSGWIAGAAVMVQWERASQSLDSTASMTAAGALSEHSSEASLFGQGSYRFGKLLVTGGLRIARDDLFLSGGSVVALQQQSASAPAVWRVLPTAELSWDLSTQMTASIGYREGSRSRTATLRHFYDPTQRSYQSRWRPVARDRIRVVNAGFAFRKEGLHPLKLDVTLSGASWTNIQADQLTPLGFIENANVGALQFLNLDAGARWRPVRSVELTLGASVTKGSYDPYRLVNIHELASIPDIVLYAAAGWSRELGADWQMSMEARAQYRGESRLGRVALHRIQQGNIFTSNAGINLAHGRFSGSLSIENLTNTRQNLFGFGNPFTLADRPQETPPRPRNLTVTLHANF